MSSRWIRLLGAAFACLLLLGCGEDGPEPEDNEIANLEETAPLANLVDESQSPTDGLQIVTIENRSDKTIWAYAYHNGCDVNAISGLCHDEGLSPGTSMTYTPDGIIRSYDDVVKVFTYVAEAIQMAVSVVLTVATAGAGSGFIAEEVAQVAGEAADAAVEAVEAGAEGAEAAGAGAEASIEDGLNLSI